MFFGAGRVAAVGLCGVVPVVDSSPEVCRVLGLDMNTMMCDYYYEIQGDGEHFGTTVSVLHLAVLFEVTDKCVC